MRFGRQSERLDTSDMRDDQRMSLCPVVRLSYWSIIWIDSEDEDGYEETSGWADDRGGRYGSDPADSGDGVSLVPDEFDREDGETVTSLAASFLIDRGIINPSSSHFHPGIWYSSESETIDYRTGEEESLSAHFYGLGVAEQFFVWYRVTHSFNLGMPINSAERQS